MFLVGLILVISAALSVYAVACVFLDLNGRGAHGALYVGGFGLCACIVIVGGFGSIIAGKGDSERFADEWVKRWRPGAVVECQARDSDDNGYNTCTVGWTDDAGVSHVDAIECGINRWYQGFNVTGCRPMKGYQGER